MIETPTPTRTEEIRVTADSLLATFRQLVHEGNVRRIGLKNEEGHVVAEFPLTGGVIGAIFFPQVAAVGAIAALLAHFTIVVERTEDEANPGT
jgi:aryl-alcohol dehydrogenase-like predicted oxidoreductase